VEADVSDWRRNLGEFLKQSEDAEQETDVPRWGRFISDVVLPAFAELRDEFEEHGREVSIRESGSSPSITVSQKGSEEMTYRISERTFPDRTLPFAEIRVRERKGLRLISLESMSRSGPPTYETSDITKEEVIENFLQNYMARVVPR